MARNVRQALQAEGAWVDISQDVGKEPSCHTGPERGEEKGPILVSRVFTVMALAAVSSSLTAFKALPWWSARIVDDPHTEHRPDETVGRLA